MQTPEVITVTGLPNWGYRRSHHAVIWVTAGHHSYRVTGTVTMQSPGVTAVTGLPTGEVIMQLHYYWWGHRAVTSVAGLSPCSYLGVTAGHRVTGMVTLTMDSCMHACAVYIPLEM